MASTDEINVLAMVKGNERYILLFDDANKGNAIRQADEWACHDELDFTWYDAHRLVARILTVGTNRNVFKIN